MNARTLLLVAAGLAVVALASWLAWRAQRTLLRGLPPKTEHASVSQARDAAFAYALAHGGSVVPIAGTGSQAPYIPAARPGEDPKDPLAFAVTSAGKGWADITPGALVIYRPAWHPSSPVMHQAAQFSAGGWVMSGLHNERSESWERMTPEKFLGLVAYVATRAP